MTFPEVGYTKFNWFLIKCCFFIFSLNCIERKVTFQLLSFLTFFFIRKLLKVKRFVRLAKQNFFREFSPSFYIKMIIAFSIVIDFQTFCKSKTLKELSLCHKLWCSNFIYLQPKVVSLSWIFQTLNSVISNNLSLK